MYKITILGATCQVQAIMYMYQKQNLNPIDFLEIYTNGDILVYFDSTCTFKKSTMIYIFFKFAINQTYIHVYTLYSTKTQEICFCSRENCEY